MTTNETDKPGDDIRERLQQGIHELAAAEAELQAGGDPDGYLPRTRTLRQQLAEQLVRLSRRASCGDVETAMLGRLGGRKASRGETAALR